MYLNPVKNLKNYFINFQRYFYDPNATYVDKLIEKWIKFVVPAFLDILITGFITWLFFISFISIFPINWIKLGPGVWNLLNIIQLGLIIWVFESTYRFLRSGGKK